MSEQQERGVTVAPETGLIVLKKAKEAIYAAIAMEDIFEGQGDSPAGAVSTAIVGYQNALTERANLRGVIAECLALNPIVSGDMKKVRVWAQVLERMKALAGEAECE